MHSDTSAAEEIRTLTFDDLPLAPFLKETVKAIGYTHPTPIQAEAIPLVVEGRDLIGLAQTGTGKTAAFILPILQKLSGTKEKGAKALILAPTRELAEQINDVIKELAPRTGIKSVTIYGGVSHARQVSELRGKPQIIVACPGRLLDHLSARTFDLKGIEYLVLDEADRMCDMGFLPDIKKIISKLPTERQTLLFSATMPSEIRELTRGIQNDPAVVQVKIEDANASVSHAMFQIAQASKPHVLAHWLQENREALVVVFTKMKHTAKRLAEQLARKGQHVTSLHGNLSQGKRQQALNGFKDGRYRVLIATDIAARGIDVKGITHVVNYDMPENLDAYIHRTGRAGRASATGEAVSFVTKADGSLLRTIERWLKIPVTRLETPELDGVEEEVVDTERGGRRQRPGRNARRERPGRRERTERGARPPREGASLESAEVAGSDSAATEPRRERRERSDRSERPARRFGDRRDRSPRAPRNGDRPQRERSDRPQRERSDGAQRERSERGFARRDRGESPGRQRFNDRRDRQPGERGPRYAYGPESEGRNARPQVNRDERGSRPRGRFSERSNGGSEQRNDRFGGRSSFERGGEGNARRGQPRDRFESLEGPDMSQVDALKVLEKRERAPRGGARGARTPRGRGGFGGGRPQRSGNRDQAPRRTWDR
jgi:ATP-dependent RNA helicase RhlE